jgi:crotonobetainyl-CoA:carnitine CoA-transferase CaiB-like acyl-CoA transferase
MSGPLEGIRVLDLSRVLAGPWAGQLLGDYGADVVKVERPVQGDETRHWGPPWFEAAGGRESAYFLSANRAKRSVTLDFSRPTGQGVIRALAEKADILIENFRAGTLQRYSLGPDTLLEANPSLVYCSITAYGQESSRAAEPGYDAMIQASGGLMSITGPPDAEGGGPQKVGVAIADLMTGMYAVTAILAALEERHRSGRGQALEIPLYDSQAAMLANQAMNYLVGGEVPVRRGTAHPNLVPYQAFASRDGHFVLAVGNDRQFAACMDVVGHPELATDERFATNAARVTNRDALLEFLGPAMRRETTSHWLEAFRSVGVPAGPINTVQEVLSGPYAEERGLVRTVRHALGKPLPTVANPVRFSRSAIGDVAPPPMLGEHTAGVLRDWLGYTDTQIEELSASGAI